MGKQLLKVDKKGYNKINMLRLSIHPGSSRKFGCEDWELKNNGPASLEFEARPVDGKSHIYIRLLQGPKYLLIFWPQGPYVTIVQDSSI